MRTAIVKTGVGKFGQTVRIGPHTFVADEGPAQGGDDAGPEPHEWLLAGLGACTSMTVGAYARRKGWPLEAVEVSVDGEHTGGAFVLTRRVLVKGDLSEEQRARLLEIADKCPVHKSLSGPIRIDTTIGALDPSRSPAP
jgi:putative redox protein